MYPRLIFQPILIVEFVIEIIKENKKTWKKDQPTFLEFSKNRKPKQSSGSILNYLKIMFVKNTYAHSFSERFAYKLICRQHL